MIGKDNHCVIKYDREQHAIRHLQKHKTAENAENAASGCEPTSPLPVSREQQRDRHSRFTDERQLSCHTHTHAHAHRHVGNTKYAETQSQCKSLCDCFHDVRLLIAQDLILQLLDNVLKKYARSSIHSRKRSEN